MKPEEQIKALAELDGCNVPWLHMNGLWNYTNEEGKTILVRPYLTSYDAIIPLIQKQSLIVKQSVTIQFMKNGGWSVGDDLIAATPSQLCEALLRATGKWKE